MKLQNLAIIFIIIMLPISIVLSEYIKVQSNAIKSQVGYDSILINSTYDAIKAFEINSRNNNYSSINNSKIRDIEASISTFYKSLATSFGVSDYSEEDLKEYIPAVLFTLYDGYYIYSRYEEEIDTNTHEKAMKIGLKPMMYYSCRYKTDDNRYDFIVNYTLDNSITVIGEVDGSYVNKTGYLIDLNSIPINLDGIETEADLTDLAIKGMNSGSAEIVTENLIILGENGNEPVQYDYLTYNGQKIYKENGINDSTLDRYRYFYYSSEYKKDYVNSPEIISYLNEHFRGGHLYTTSSYEYYARAKVFTKWAKDKLKRITQKNAVDSQGNAITDFASSTDNEKIFDTNSTTNNPLSSESTFNENRLSVIRKSIERSLITSIQTFSHSSSTQYNFSMPQLSEVEWYNIENNIAMVTFMQGLPASGRIYNNYCVVTNNTNEEMLSKESLYVIDSNGEYHRPGCKALAEKLNNAEVQVVGMYSSVDFKRQSISTTGEDSNAHTQITGSSEGNYNHYYKHTRQSGADRALQACYDCIVTIADTYSVDDLVLGKSINIGDSIVNYTNINGYNYNRAFLIALARERYDTYITNGYLINN